MNNTIPPEIKKWIKGYADAHDFLRSDINEIIVKALTSLYQHLQENGRVAELEKEVYSLNQKIYEGISENGSLKQEIERLKGLVNDSFQMAMDFSYKEGLSHGHYKKAETLFNNFKTKHNL